MRASKNQWAISPETIISHHFRLTKGVAPVVDQTPPYSMYNSPISIHYIPKRSSSAEPFRRTMSKSQRELNDFVNGRNGDSQGLRLPLPIRSSLTNLVKPKLLENRNYQPPRRRTTSKTTTDHHPHYHQPQDLRNTIQINRFKDAVLSECIRNEMYSDEIILNLIKSNMELLAGSVPWDDLEKAANELIEHLGINTKSSKRRSSNRRNSEKRTFHKPPLPMKLASPKSLESLSSSSNSSKTSSSSSSSSAYESTSAVSSASS